MTAPPIRLAIAGVEKAGTTSLLRALSAHPAVQGQAALEMNYFVSEAEYCAGWPAAYRRYFDPARPDRMVLAKSVALFDSERALDRLYAHNPLVQVAVVLREPASRAWSAYWYARRMQREPLPSFEQAVAAELAGRGDRRYLARGRYGPRVEALLRRFGRQQVQVWLLDDLKRDLRLVCAEGWRRLGLEPHALEPPARHNRAAMPRWPWLTRSLNVRGPVKSLLRPLVPLSVRGRVRERLLAWNERPAAPPAMAPETRAWLLEQFRDDNAALARLLGRELSAWER